MDRGDLGDAIAEKSSISTDHTIGPLRVTVGRTLKTIRDDATTTHAKLGRLERCHQQTRDYWLTPKLSALS